MSRLLLLNLREQDADVLTRIREINPEPQVLVFHQDPNALIMRLANLAELPSSTDRPVPQDDDVVVWPKDPKDTFVEAWADLGSNIVSPQHFSKETWEDRMNSERTEKSAPKLAPAPTPSAPKESPAPTPSGPKESPAPTPSAPKESPAPTPSGPKESPEPTASAPKASPAPTPSAASETMPISALETPEASFRYLAEQAIGSSGIATLWWDGGIGYWAPWAWTGNPPAGQNLKPQGGLDIPTNWGRFRLTGREVENVKWNRDALKRVAEDMALRDLMAWNKRASEMKGASRISNASSPSDIAAWFDQVFSDLDPKSAMVWRSQEKGWSLVTTHGEGLAFSGDLTLPFDLLAPTFEATGTPWTVWEPTNGVRTYFQFSAEDPRWALRMRRLETATEVGGNHH